MRRDPRVCLEDMRQAAEAILQFTAGRQLADYGSDPLLRAAVERKFEIIGEALTRLAKIDAGLAAQVPQQRQIVGFRNQLIHSYDTINDVTVWDIVQKDLPALVGHVEKVL